MNTKCFLESTVLDRLHHFAAVQSDTVAIAEAVPVPSWRQKMVRWITTPLCSLFSLFSPRCNTVASTIVTKNSGRRYRTVTFAELDQLSDQLAQQLRQGGVTSGTKLVLMAKPGIDFTANVFAVYKSGATLVLIDPGMGVSDMIKCLAAAAPDGVILPLPPFFARQFFRCLYGKKLPTVRLFFPTWVEKKLLFSGRCEVCGSERPEGKRFSVDSVPPCETNFSHGDTKNTEKTTLVHNHPLKGTKNSESADIAAIIFTSGSTGVAKGVEFTHGIFDIQVQQIAEEYNLLPGSTDLACFPFFGLFNAAMGITAVIPDMNSMKPASVKPVNILTAAADWNVSQSFGSPALWNRVADFCHQTGQRLTSVKKVMIAGAPISPALLEKVERCIAVDGEVFTPYGATEALPVASVGSREVLTQTANITRNGGGINVGKHFSQIRWRVIPLTDAPIPSIDDVPSLPPGEIGELAVCGPQVTKRYVTRTEANEFAKMTDTAGNIWHRMGDVGYLDREDRFFFCGRKSHRVVEVVENGADGETITYFTIPCEAVFNGHPRVYRSALVGVNGRPVIVVEPCVGQFPRNKVEEETFIAELRALAVANPLTSAIETIRFHRSFPVDVRHNAKINREKLAIWV